MLGLPQSTEVKRSFPKAQLYKKFELKQSQRDAIDIDIVRMEFVNIIASQSLPAIAEGAEIKSIYVINVVLKRHDYDIKTINLITRLIPQHVIYVLQYDDKVQLAIYHTKLFIGQWQDIDSTNISLSGINLDNVWENIVASIGNMELVEGNSLVEQIKIDEQREKTLRQIANLEKQMRTTAQTRKQREIYAQIKKLKALL